jgi:carboxypeptidase C (cathepsin A)
MTLRQLVPTALLLLALPVFAQRQRQGPAETPAPGPSTPPAGAAKPPAAPETKPDLLPEDKSVAQTITVNGKTLHYTATVGKIALKGDDGKPTGEVMYTAYTLDHAKGGLGISEPGRDWAQARGVRQRR